MKQILLTKGTYAIVDDEDYQELNQYNWYLSNSGYAARQSPRNHHKRHLIHMHRVVNKTPEGLFTDHINGNPLDNRRKNLRAVTASQNHMNKRLQSNSTSGYKGAFFHKPSKRWRAQIRVNRKAIHLGYFDSAQDAHEAYRAAAKDLFGKFARYG